MTNQQLIDELVGNAHGNMARVQEILTQHPDLVNAARAGARHRCKPPRRWATER